MDRFAATKMQIVKLRDMDLLYPNTTYVHASHFTDEEWALARDSGGNVSFAPQIEIQMGHGWAPGCDGARSTACRSGSRRTSPPRRRPTSSPRCARSSARSAAASTRQAWDADLDGNVPSPDLITSRQVLTWATLGGAQVAGIADRTGSITPGKKADIVIIDGSAVNVAPVIDPVGAVVCAADVSNVKTVLVDGEILKQDFKLAASLDGPRARRRGLARLPALEVRRSGARLAAREGHGLSPSSRASTGRRLSEPPPEPVGPLPAGPAFPVVSGVASLACAHAYGPRGPRPGRRLISSRSAAAGKASSVDAVGGDDRGGAAVAEVPSPVDRGDLAEVVARPELVDRVIADAAPRAARATTR